MDSVSSPILKICTRCHQAKPPTDFYPHKRRKTGLSERCKPCHAAGQHGHNPDYVYNPHPHSGLPHPDRFWAKVRKTATCWWWLGAHDKKGYGTYRLQVKGYPAHRMAYMLLRGPIPDGLDLDHLCRNPACVNPDHLEPVTRAENTARGDCAALKRAKTHCKHGHPFTPENTLLNKRGHRQCRACLHLGNRLRYRASKGLPADADLSQPATHCKRGHAFSPENTGRTKKGHRRCITCGRQSSARNREKQANETLT